MRIDVEAVILDGAMDRSLLDELLAGTAQALAAYNWEGLFEPPRLQRGSIGADARALGGALLPLHASFAPEHEVFLKTES